MQARYSHGNVSAMLDHTPSSAVAVGDVVVVGERPLVAHNAIAANELGALAAGGGVYTVAKEAPLVIADEARLYWDDTNNRVTTTASTHKIFGFAVKAGASADTTILAQHQPAV